MGNRKCKKQRPYERKLEKYQKCHSRRDNELEVIEKRCHNDK
jgi:hypothetical protein